jgi:hypothetical protein
VHVHFVLGWRNINQGSMKLNETQMATFPSLAVLLASTVDLFRFQLPLVVNGGDIVVTHQFL